VDSNTDGLPVEGLSKTDPLREAELKEEEEEYNYQVTRLAKIQGELDGKAGESSTRGLLAEHLAKYGLGPSEDSAQEANTTLNEYYKTVDTYHKAVRAFNDANELLVDSTDLNETQRAQLLAESQHLRDVAEKAANHANTLRSLVDIPSEPEMSENEEEYSGEDYGSEENSGKESSDEESRPSKRPRN
jgi:hypothetical protein